MRSSTWIIDGGNTVLDLAWEDGDQVILRGRRTGAGGEPHAILAVIPAAEHPTPPSLDRLVHEYGLRDELDRSWAARPLELVREHARTVLVREDPGGEPLPRALGAPMNVESFLRRALGITKALDNVHARGLIHKDLRPANILLDDASGQVWLTGFGSASRLARERQIPQPPELIATAYAYLAPEQTGRMNRSIDSRSDLYSLGVICYEMLTGTLPFTAATPQEWMHCHIARRPVSPAERSKDLPGPISAIIMKLLAKTAEERYQTAAGAAYDLQRCIDAWEAVHRIPGFALGERDTPDRLLIPERLYGRAREIDTLLASFDRVVSEGTPELVLVSGYSGVGKSSVVNELQKALVLPRGLFASGKFDQHKRDIPYATLAQAFQGLIHPLLGKSDADLRDWRNAFVEALGSNGMLIADLVPELKHIIGPQPPVPDLPLRDAQARFHLVMRRFVRVFAQAQHPLALFLDDLQWLDAATLNLLEDLLTSPDLRHLLFIGAYRDNEVDEAHPLMRTLEVIRRAGTPLQQIVLAPLAIEDLQQLLADSLHCMPERAAALAQLAHGKTAGNPYFATQFIAALAAEQLLFFDHGAASWSWDLERIRAKAYTDNVADLMVGKLNRLPTATLQAIQEFACLGSTAEMLPLGIALGRSEQELHENLWPAVTAELIVRTATGYKFIHDLVREAAYSVIPEPLRAAVHLRIGRSLVTHTPPERREGAIFEIVNQINRGADLIESQAERDQAAELNLLAGRRAQASSAYSAALTYLIAGHALLDTDSWEQYYRLTFELEFHRAECEILTGALAAAEERLATLLRESRTIGDTATVVCLSVDLYTNLDQADRAVQIGLECLGSIGIIWSAHPTDQEVDAEYTRIWQQLGNRPVEELLELPSMTDTNSRAAVDVLTSMQSPAHFTDGNLVSLIIGRMANLSLEHGNTDGSCFAYVYLGTILEARFGDYVRGLRFGNLGIHLLETRSLGRFRARVYNNFGMAISPWATHIRASIDLLRYANHAAREAGDVTFEGYSSTNLISASLIAGDSLSDLQKDAESALVFLQRARFGTAIDMVLGQLGLIRALRGLTSDVATFNHAGFDESRFERHLQSNAGLVMSACWYWVRKMQAYYLAADITSAVTAAARAEALLWTSPAFIITADYHFYAALVRAAEYGTAPPDARTEIARILGTHLTLLRVWAANCPDNFDNRAVLVCAEVARIEGRPLDAMHLYDEAVRSANTHGFVHNEALANEVAARFYEALNFATIARTYMRHAAYCYLRWGAVGKVRQLHESYPYLREADSATGPTATVAASVEQLDLATVVRVLRAVSSDIVMEKLTDTLIRTAVEHAGAERGVLILFQGNERRIEAEATTGEEAVDVQVRKEATAVLPQSIIHYVERTQESVILDDASVHGPFSTDPYIRQRRARSVLCLPLTSPLKLIGVLYLENNLASRVFTAPRIAVLKLLASQAAISLENTKLYGDLEEREARIRRLVDANIIGIFIWSIEGRILEANDAFLRMLHYDRDDLHSDRLRWNDLTPPDYAERELQAIDELRATGIVQPYEKEYFRKDGTRVPVLLGCAFLAASINEGVAFVLDLTEKKRAEQEARDSEQRYRDVQAQLAHASRVATMGQLSSSIAHEVAQPIAAAGTNADAALQWLAAHPPNVEKAREALARIVKNARRAGDVLGRIRELIKKAPPHKDDLDINDTILEIVALTRGEATKHDILVTTQLAEGLPSVKGDRVQLQQVVLNLIMNAVEAMSAAEGDRLHELLISARRTADGIVVAVADSGPGIESASLERLREAFYTTKPGGLGMGLSICTSIVESHGGRLHVTANIPRGAIFEFTLPVEPGHGH
jgi:PAS domain S-box-containing protein